jgi:NIPSNAP
MQCSFKLKLTILSLLLTILPVVPASQAQSGDDVIHQLRIYQLFDNTREAFHERFRDHAERIMERYDFHIVAMWESRTEEGPEFVYLLEWPDEQTMKDRWAAFMADQEWSDIKVETGRIHGQFVGDIEDRTLFLTDYSPNRSLLRQN